jgi:asparagine synthetase B (glutamine-hydrolysing)
VNAGIGLTPLDIASGLAYGEAEAPPLPDVPRTLTFRDALERAVRRALERPPCVVMFSGGCDSSVMLALAVALARREGLPPPVAFTQRVPSEDAGDESSWQELVVRHLGVEEWIVRDLTDELDVLGEIARRTLRRHGLLWTTSVHFCVPALEHAAPGSLVTGVGGDQLLFPGRHRRLAAVLARRVRPTGRDVVRGLLTIGPGRLRERRRRRDAGAIETPWLRPAAQAELEQEFAREAAQEPVRRDAWVRWQWRRRTVQMGLASMRLLAADAGAGLVQPFYDLEVQAAFGRWASEHAPPHRRDVLLANFGDLLPREILERRTKAGFEAAYRSGYSREFAASLDPEEVDSEYVDGRRAVRYWTDPDSAPISPFRSLALLQSIWLARDRAEERRGGGVDGAPVARTP